MQRIRFSRSIFAAVVGASLLSSVGVVAQTGTADVAATPTFGVGSGSVVEGDTAGTREIKIPVTLSDAPGGQYTVKYDVTAASATAGTDFKASSNKTLTFKAGNKPGNVRKVISVPVYPDTNVEADETFTVTLSAPSAGSVLGNATGTGTVVDDDLSVGIRIAAGDVQVVEADSGGGPAGTIVQFAATLSMPNPGPTNVTVQLSTSSGTATAGSDFTAPKPRTLTFKPGKYKAYVTMKVARDTTPEADESFQLNLSNPSAGATVDRAVGTATIQDDDAAPPTWTATGSLADTRTQHTATMLPNGKVLVAGGAGSGCRTVAELYDPATGTWTATGTMVSNHTGHTATLLPSGKVLVAGGEDCVGFTSVAELYDPATGTFAATGSMTSVRTQHAATLLPNGKVLVTNGIGSGSAALPTAELYDPVAGTWAATGPMAYNHGGYHTATLLTSGKVLVAGGQIAGSGSELYDPVTGVWTSTGSMAEVRSQHTATLLPGGKVLVAAGYNGGLLSSAELYDPVTGTWSGTGGMADSRLEHTATLLPGGKVLVAGGWDGAAFSARSSAELYDPVTGTWAATASMTAGRQNHTATLLPSGKVLVAAGNLWSIPLSSAELYF